jgi:polyisoprenoid-binding protein YceI
MKGHFGNYQSTIITEDESFDTAKVSFEAEVASISTDNEQRDAHLKAADFFDVETYPKITFNSTGVSKISEKEFIVTGDLTIKGITRSIQLNVMQSGMAKDPWGQTKIAFEINGAINRTDFGLVWNAPLETGGVLLSEEVKLLMEVQFSKS